MSTLKIETPRWALPFLKPAMFKGAKGGRSSGKSHTFAENVIEAMVMDPTLSVVCVREYQKRIEYSAKRTLEGKIRKFGLSHMFDIQKDKIERKGGGIIVFMGMQDHTADSIKSLEDFRLCWIEEAQRLSAYSLNILFPTIIRNKGAEIWATWNPDQPDTPIEAYFRTLGSEAILSHVNYDQNPFLDQSALDYIASERARLSPEDFAHIWLGAYNTKSDAQVFAGRFQVQDFEPQADWDGPYHGADWGFASDPTTLVQCYIAGRTLYIRREIYRHSLMISDIGPLFKTMTGITGHVILGDAARPDIIAHLKQKEGLRAEAAPKWPESVIQGVEYIKDFDRVIIHPDCPMTEQEFRLYSYKRDRLTEKVKPDILDGVHDHCIDAIRYALAPLIKRTGQTEFIRL